MGKVARIFAVFTEYSGQHRKGCYQPILYQRATGKDEELAEFIKYHRSHWKEKEQAAKDWQAEYDRFMRDEAAKEKAELEAQRQRERESEARLEAYRAERDRNAQTQKPVNRDEPIPKPRPKNDFEI